MTASQGNYYFKGAWAILALALVLRVIWGTLIPVVPVSDGTAYNILAHNLVDHGFYGWSADRLSAFWPPGTSALYAAIYSIFGFSFAPIVAVNTVLSTAIVALTISLGRICFDDTIALIAGALMAIWPSEVAFVTILASEVPFTFLVLVGAVIWFGGRQPKIARAIASGLAFGAASYFRPIAVLLPIIVWLTAISNWHKLREQWSLALLAVIITGIVIAPWCMRNSAVFGHPMFVTTSDGVNLWMGNNPDTAGFYMVPSDPAVAGLGEYEKNKVLKEQAEQYIETHPGAFVLRTIKKAVLLHAGETIAVHWNDGGIQQRFGERALFAAKVVTDGFWLMALLLGLIGVVIVVGERGLLLSLSNPVLLIWIYFTGVYAVIVVEDRYHIPSHPFIAIFAGVAISAALRRRRSKLVGPQLVET
jgi:4-amino-4-deoxy-L-arabinose transferase-like glycosyltransferase